ncbi:MAG: DUF998 domain-containing protein [Nakamurella sp.]
MDRWWRIGVGLTVLSTAAAVAMQAVAGRWFPPPVSVSQYGIGPWGWLFSVFVVTMSTAPLYLERLSARRPRLVRLMLWAGLAGAVVMAVVRTDSGGAQASLNAKVHMVGSIVCLTFVPLGMFALFWLRGGAARIVGFVEILLVEVSITLLLCAAFGLDTAGIGAARSWALWQAVASVASVLMVVTLSVVLRPGRDDRRNHTGRPVPDEARSSILVKD